MALNLKKLDKEVTDLLNKETEESLQEWLDRDKVRVLFNSIKYELTDNQQLKLLSMLATNIYTAEQLLDQAVYLIRLANHCIENNINIQY